MRRNSQNTDYRYYSYKPPSSSSSSQNTHYQYYDYRLRSQETPYNYTPQRHYQSPLLPSTAISNLAEPFFLNHQSNLTPLPSTYLSPNLSRSSSFRDARLTTANAMRERILTDIQRTISEIDQELY
jgi:hypothetical protein